MVGGYRVKIFAHRGASGAFPENTIAAFQKAAQLPVDGVEFDVHLTKDQQLVVIHDEKIDRTSKGAGYVKDMTLAELRQYDYGSWFDEKFARERIPTLREVLHIFRDTQHLINIELKTDVFAYDGIEQLVLQEVFAHDVQHRTIISSFDHEILSNVTKLAPNIEVAALFSDLLIDYVTYGKQIPVNVYHVSKSIAVRAPIKKVIEAGYPVRVYTVNKISQAKQLANFGVAAIFTDEPEKMLAYIK